VLTSCGSSAGKDQASYEKDKAAVIEVRRIQASLAQSPNVLQSDLDLLKRLHEKYPGVPEVQQALQNALQVRQDWAALETLLTQKPESERTTQDQILLAKVYIKLGRYADASRILGPMADAAPNDLELNSLAAHAWYNAGKYDEASRVLDRVWNAIVASGAVDELTMRGMIYFYRGDKDRAIEVLRKAVEIKPDHIPANNALARVYAAKGDQTQAERYRAQAESSHARQTADESRGMRVTSRSRDLEAAFAAGRYDEAIQIAREMLQLADDAQKPVIYEYLAKAYQASGRQAEAQTALQDAARLRR
jgi:tetratricopeptide (TPR) repeat protein